MTIADLRKKRAAAYDSFAAVATKDGVLSDGDKKTHADLRQAVKDLDDQIERTVEAQELASRSARPVDGDDQGVDRVLARRPVYSKLKSYKDIATDRGVIRGEEQAYRMGKWLLATMYGVPEARQWCADHGVPIVRAQSEGVNSAGGELVPEEMMASIIVLRETFGVFRREAQVIPMGRDTMNWPRRTGGVTAYFVSEGTAPTQSQAAWDNVNLTAKKLASLVLLSTELSDDAIINVADYLTSEIAYAFASKEDDCGFNGDGTSTYGGITGLTATSKVGSAGLYTASGHATFDVLTATDIEQMRALLPFYALPNAKIYCSQYAFALCFERLIAAGGGNSIATLNGEIVYRYLGTPIVISQKLPSTTPTGKVAILYGDMAKAAALGERRQVSIKRSDERYFDTDQIGIMGTERVDVNVHDVGDSVNAGPIVALKMG
jgi:HK97 family phage major capsid protein